MSWLHYLIEANIYLGVFYLCYCLFLNRDTHYMLGRAYLIFSCVMAFILPLTQVSILKPAIAEIEIVEPVQQVTIIPAQIQHKLVVPVRHFTFDDAMIYLYIAGAVIAFFVLLFRLRKLYILTRSNHAMYQDQYKLVHLNDENTAFSFFNYLFIGSNVPQAETIIAHELVHIRQKHSVDIIFMEVIKIVNWFNPFIYLIQRSLKTIHEYIADEQTAAQEQDALAYSSFLLNNAYGIQGSSIAHSFFNYNLLKKRIIMLNKNRSGKLARLKYLAALPLCAGMLCASTLVFSKDYGLIELAPRKIVKPHIDSTKYALKLTEIKTNMWQITDKFSISNKKTGIESFYTVNNITEKDKADFKKRGFEVTIVEREKAQTDTGKKKLPPPPPPAPPKLKGKVPPPPVVEIHKTPPPPPPSAPKKPSKVAEIEIESPPSPYIVKVDKPLKTVRDAKGKVAEVRIDKPMEVKIDKPMVLKLDKQGSIPPPPPPAPTDPVYNDLLKAMMRTIRYPAVARDNKINGHNILSFTINSDHKITDVKVEKGIGYRCDEEAARALKAYSGTVNKAPGTYKIAVTFMLANEDNEKYYAPKPLGDDIQDASNFIGQVVITGYVKD